MPIINKTFRKTKKKVNFFAIIERAESLSRCQKRGITGLAVAIKQRVLRVPATLATL
jgi:hypothetical protein